MSGPTARVLELLSLLQARRVWRGSELAGRLEVSERTVRRDVERLRDLGYPVEAEPGSSGGYRLAAGAHLPPLVLDDDEAVAIAVGLQVAAGGVGVAGLEETSVRALVKLGAGAAAPAAPARERAQGRHRDPRRRRPDGRP